MKPKGEKDVDITKVSAVELSKVIKAGELTVMEAVVAQLEEIRKKEARYHCYISVWEEKAIERAREVQKKMETGEYANSPLVGVPIAVKDNICTKGMLTTCASRMLSNFCPPYDAEAVARLEAAGCVILGKTNLDEFAMGSTTETSWFGATKNPHNIEYVSGGSSGGSAAAVAAGEAVAAIGSDTGGSIRQPSAFCGVVGLKPTYGMVSRYGLIAYASSLDQIGSIGRTVEDCATVLQVIAGEDLKDSTCMSGSPSYSFQGMKESIQGKRIGLLIEYQKEGLSKEVQRAILEVAQVLKECGARIEEVEFNAAPYAVSAYYVLACAEASSNLSRYDGVKYGFRASDYEDLSDLYKKTRSLGFGTEVKRRLLIGSFVLSSGYYEDYYKKALKVKALVREEFFQIFEKVDLILMPVAPTTAPKLGESLSDPLKMYLGDSYTVPVNLTGLPAISIPCGKDKHGLPVGVQLIGKPYQEQELLQVAYQYEQAYRGGEKGNEAV